MDNGLILKIRWTSGKKDKSLKEGNTQKVLETLSMSPLMNQIQTQTVNLTNMNSEFSIQTKARCKLKNGS